MIQSQPGLGGILEQLAKERKKLQGQLETAQRTVHHIQAELDRIESAIGALKGEVGVDPARSDRKRALTGGEVGMFIEKILTEEGRQTEKKLRELLNDRASGEGRSRQGIHLRFKKALREGPFSFNGAHWELRK